MISTDELAYHERLLAQLRSAQAAWQSWSEHLAQKYELREGDAITASGEIVRAPAEDEPAE